MGSDIFTIERVGTTGHEIRDPNGNVVAWAASEPWAHIIVALLNRVESDGLGRSASSGSDVRPTGA